MVKEIIQHNMHGAEVILVCGAAETQEDKKHCDDR